MIYMVLQELPLAQNLGVDVGNRLASDEWCT